MKNHLIKFTVRAVTFAVTALFIFSCFFFQNKQSVIAETAVIFPNENYAFTEENNVYSLENLSGTSVSVSLADSQSVFIKLPENVMAGTISIWIKGRPDAPPSLSLVFNNSVSSYSFSTSSSLDNAGEIKFDSSMLSTFDNNKGLTFIATNYTIIKGIRITSKLMTEFENVKAGDVLSAPSSFEDKSFIGWNVNDSEFINDSTASEITATEDGSYKAVYASLTASCGAQLRITTDSSNLGIRFEFVVDFRGIDLNNVIDNNAFVNKLFTSDKNTLTMFAEHNGSTLFKTQELKRVVVDKTNNRILFYSQLLGVDRDLDKDSWYIYKMSAKAEITLCNLPFSASSLSYSIDDYKYNEEFDESLRKVYGFI